MFFLEYRLLQILLNHFQCGIWHSVHIDDLHPDSNMLEIQELRGRTIGDIFISIVKKHTPPVENRYVWVWLYCLSHIFLVLRDHLVYMYVVYIWKWSSAHAQRGVSGVASFITIDEQLQ